MSKPYYETEEYSEAENELDTYDDKVKLVMEYIVSEKHKDQQIAELQKQLEEKEQIIQMQQNIKRYDIGEMLTENIKLRQKLHSQPSDIIKKIKKEFQKHLIDWYEDEENTNSELYLDADWVWEILDTILKEYGGKDV